MGISTTIPRLPHVADIKYCTSGDLGSLIRKAQRTNTPIHEDKIWNIFLQITLALHHCHWPEQRAQGRIRSSTERTQVLHRDLKPENVFLSGDIVKLGDFGLSKDMGGCAFTSTYVGTPLYMPPEILAENRYDTKSDMWSLGCLVFEMCALSSPFSTATTQEELISMVKSGKLPPLPGHISPTLKSVIRAMLSLNPVRRPSTKDLLEMDEMKLHRKLFQVQNQASILSQRKEEFIAYESRLAERSAQLERRERALAEREAALTEREADMLAREAALTEREDILRENHKLMALANASLREQWETLRLEKEAKDAEVARLAALSRSAGSAGTAGTGDSGRDREGSVTSLDSVDEDACVADPPPTRRRYQYEDTPSKIPLPCTSPLPLRNQRSAGALGRKAVSKSMTNLVSARLEPPVPALPGPGVTPKKQQPSPNRHVAGRTSIGSPGELERVFEQGDVSMRTASFASPAPGQLPTPLSRFRRRQSSLGGERGSFLPMRSDLRAEFQRTAVERKNSAERLMEARVERGELREQRAERPAERGERGERPEGRERTSGAERGERGLGADRERGYGAERTDRPINGGNGAIGGPDRLERRSAERLATPSKPTFIYRPDQTPARWNADDPDAPSPFLKKQAETANMLALVEAELAPFPSLPTREFPGARERAERTERAERAPLGTIQPNGVGSGGVGGVGGTAGAVPGRTRSKSQTLHANVLRHNAARSSEALRKR